MTAPDIAELRRLLEGATPGPWRWVWDSGSLWLWSSADGMDVGAEGMILAPHVCPTCQRTGQRCLGPDEPDAALIVALVNAAPALLDRLEAAERVAGAAAGVVALLTTSGREPPPLNDSGLLSTLGFYAGPNARTAVDQNTVARFTRLAEATRALRAALKEKP